MKKSFFILAAIFIFAALLRFYKLDQNPPSLNLDEVGIGYNAYAVLKTGKDEYGQSFPLAFRSHDDYKPPLYIYLTSLSIAVFGLNQFAVRFLSALAGSLTVLVTYFLVKELFTNNTTMKQWSNEAVATTAALLLAISPWHLQFSRGAFETNLAVFFIATGLWAFLKARQGKILFWILSAISFSLALYTYQAVRLFLPLFLLPAALIFYESIRSQIKKAVIAGSVFLALSAPLVPIMTSEEGLMRFKGTSVFEHPGLVAEEAERVLVDAAREDAFAVKLLHNRHLAYIFTALEGYLKHFRPDFLFMGMNGPPVNYTPNVGLLYLFELPLLIVGLNRLMGMRDKKIPALIISWVLLAPIPSSFTLLVPSSTRTEIILPSLQILSALGVVALIKKIRKKEAKLRFLIFSASLAVLAFSVFRYLHQYYIHAPIEYAKAWQYGYKQAVEFSEEHLQDFDKVIVSTNLRQPQNFFAFYSKYDPDVYIFKDGGTVSGGFLETGNKFGKYEFHPIDYDNLSQENNFLLVDLYDLMPDRYKDNSLKVIDLPSGEPEIAISKS